MITIKTASDLRTYNTVLEKAEKLMSALMEGRDTGEKNGYIPLSVIREQYK